ncbi:MAG: P-II family nitrogen regulator [Calditrichaceae bacterium]|jgi:nitrogen regulatory protein P-II 1
MKLIIFILNKEERLEEVLEAFLELGINGATILDSIGMGRILAHDIPIFAGFQNLLHDSRPGNKTIISVVPDQKVKRVVRAVEQIIGSLDEPGNGLFMSLPVDYVKGYREI